MNPTITSLVPVIISKDDRGNKILSSGIVEIEIVSITRNLSNDNRVFRVEDFLTTPGKETVSPEGNTVSATPSRQKIKQGVVDNKSIYHKEITKTKEEYEGLLAYFKTTYPEATYNEMVSFALLKDTQENPIYNTIEGVETTPEQWQIKPQA